VAPRVTVLIAEYNAGPFLAAAIDSVLAQTFSDFELMVVDDASTDGSRGIVEGYREPRVRLIVNDRNLGAGGARNRGLAAISSEYVAFLDGDDLCFPQRLARQVAYLDEHLEVAAVGAQARLIDIAGRTIGDVRRPVTELGIRWWRIALSGWRSLPREGALGLLRVLRERSARAGTRRRVRECPNQGCRPSVAGCPCR
jgi:glycosyltransferase involved in cell wall biosynthesis